MEDSVKSEPNALIRTFQEFKRLFNLSTNLFWALIAIGLLTSSFGRLYTPESFEQPAKAVASFDATEVAIFLIFFLLMIYIAIIIFGVIGYSAFKLQDGKTVTVKVAFDISRKNFYRVFMVMLTLGLRLFGWTLLFIIPGIIMSVRYSLAAITMFAEPDLKPGEVVSRSAALTKHNWWQTFLGRYVPSIITLGLVDYDIDIAAESHLYKKFTVVKS